MLHYHLVFDVTRSGYRQWWFPAAGLIIVAVGLTWLGFRRGARPSDGWWWRYQPYLYTGFAMCWVLAAFVGTYYDYRQLRGALEAGHFQVVEGVVTNFRPVPPGLKGTECFEVSEHRYCYSDDIIIAGFNNKQSRGGPIKDGLHVRIADVRGQIARLEVALPSPEGGAVQQ